MKSIPVGFRLLLATSVPYGLVMAVLITEGDELLRVLHATLVLALMMGIPMTFLMGLGQVIASSEWGRRKATLSVDHSASIVVRMPLHDALRALSTTLGTIGAKDVRSVDEHTVVATTPFDKLSGHVHALGDGRTLLTIGSEPLSKWVIIDNGRNRRNMELALEVLEAHVRAVGGSEPTIVNRATMPRVQSTNVDHH